MGVGLAHPGEFREDASAIRRLMGVGRDFTENVARLAAVRRVRVTANNTTYLGYLAPDAFIDTSKSGPLTVRVATYSIRMDDDFFSSVEAPAGVSTFGRINPPFATYSYVGRRGRVDFRFDFTEFGEGAVRAMALWLATGSCITTASRYRCLDGDNLPIVFSPSTSIAGLNTEVDYAITDLLMAVMALVFESPDLIPRAMSTAKSPLTQAILRRIRENLGIKPL